MLNSTKTSDTTQNSGNDDDPRDFERATAQGRLGELEPVAVIDIGSNSVRQVIYEGMSRAPSVLFNEKVLCGLGKGVAATGKLDDEAVARALAAIRRFHLLGIQAGVRETHVLATAAAREASNGSAFITAVEQIVGTSVEVLTGRLEAEYSAYGVLSGFHKPEGISGDMGGGSLELIGITGNPIGGLTLPLGGLRLQETSGDNVEVARRIARKHLKEIGLQWPGHARNFYAIGGTWRSLARLHMEGEGYPLGVIHNYSVPAAEMIRFCDKVASADLDSLPGMGSVSRNRRNLLPYGAVVMSETIRHIGARMVIMSSLGVREGYIYAKLDDRERAKDPLIEATQDLAVLRARSPRHSRELARWTGEAFRTLGIDETENDMRHRRAACYLADIGWRAHADFRAEQGLATISNAGFSGINHDGRAYIALANFHRYRGLGSKIKPPKIASVATDRTIYRARILAALFRVLYLFSASVEGLIPKMDFVRTGTNQYEIRLPKELADLCGERPDTRIMQLARELEAEINLVLV